MHSLELSWLLVDLDNTILDFDKGAHAALLSTFKKFEFSDLNKLIKSYHNINRTCWQQFESEEIDVDTLKKQRFRLFVREHNLKIDPDRLNNYYLNKLSEQITEISGARDFLNKCSRRFNLLLATNGFARVQRPKIARSGIAKYFEHIVISEEIGASKPSPEFFKTAFILMGKPDPSSVMIIGDSLSSDIKGGLDFGIHTCWFNRYNSENETEIRPHHTIDQLKKFTEVWNL